MPSAHPDPLAEPHADASRPTGSGHAGSAGSARRAEAAWVDRACEGDRDAFEALAREAMPMLLGTARRLVGSGYAAEEAVAEALFRAWRRIDTFRGASGFGTWLHRILCRAVADRYRLAGRERVRRASMEAQARAGAPVAGRAAGPAAPWREVAAQDDAARWRTLLDRLPPTQRMVLLLSAWENLSLPEISETLNLRYATVKSNLHHARRALRAAWDGASGDHTSQGDSS